MSSTDLHVDIYAASSENDAVAIPGTSNDIDGESRNASTPDIGADEYSLTACTNANAGVVTASVNSLCNSGSANLSASGFSSGLLRHTHGSIRQIILLRMFIRWRLHRCIMRQLPPEQLAQQPITGLKLPAQQQLQLAIQM